MNLDKESQLTTSNINVNKEKKVKHILGDSHIEVMRQFAKDIEYGVSLKNIINKNVNRSGIFIYFALLYYCFSNQTSELSIWSYLIQSFIIFALFVTVYDTIMSLTYKFVTKVILKKHFYNIKQKKVIYLADKKNKYELLKPLAYLIEPNEELDSPENYSIKSQFSRYRYILMTTLNSSSEKYHSIEESFINMYLELYDYSKRVDAYVGEQEWQHPDYLELKQYAEDNT